MKINKTLGTLLFSTTLILSGCFGTDSSSSESSSSSTSISSSVENSSSSEQSSSSVEENSSSSQESSSSIQQDSKLFMFTSDYTTGKLFSFTPGDTILELGKEFNQDSKLAKYGSDLYVLERFGADNLVKYDYENDSVLYQVSLEDGANPVDFIVNSETKAYLSQENQAELLIVDPQTGASTDYIDLSSYVYNTNPTPNADHMLLQNDTLLVLLQRRDGWSVGGKGYVLLIDTQADSVLSYIELNHKNPVSISSDETGIYVASQGALPFTGDVVPDSTRAIEKLDLTSLSSTDILLDADLGGAPSTLVSAGQGIFYVSIYISFGNVQVSKIDISSKEVVQVSGITDAFGGIAYDSNKDLLFIGEKDPTASGLKVWNSSTMAGPFGSSELPPYDLIVVP